MLFSHSKNKTNSYLSDEDVRLMLDFKAGNVASFEVLLKKYFKRILNFIFRYVGIRSVAEDLTQEVFMRVYKSAPNYLPRAKFKTWVYTIARNTSINEVKRNKQKIVSLDEMIECEGEQIPRQVEDKTIDRPDESAIRAETARVVKKAIYALGEKQRMVIILRRYENFSYQEIAKTMKISEKAVKSLLSRGRENLKKALSSFIKNETF